jgi:hypothetical protein
LALSVLAIDIAESEDKAFFSTTTVTDGRDSLCSALANLTVIASGANSANAGAATYADLLATPSEYPLAELARPHTSPREAN